MLSPAAFVRRDYGEESNVVRWIRPRQRKGRRPSREEVLPKRNLNRVKFRILVQRRQHRYNIHDSRFGERSGREPRRNIEMVVAPARPG